MNGTKKTCFNVTHSNTRWYEINQKNEFMSNVCYNTGEKKISGP